MYRFYWYIRYFGITSSLEKTAWRKENIYSLSNFPKLAILWLNAQISTSKRKILAKILKKDLTLEITSNICTIARGIGLANWHSTHPTHLSLVFFSLNQSNLLFQRDFSWKRNSWISDKRGHCKHKGGGQLLDSWKTSAVLARISRKPETVMASLLNWAK